MGHSSVNQTAGSRKTCWRVKFPQMTVIETIEERVCCGCPISVRSSANNKGEWSNTERQTAKRWWLICGDVRSEPCQKCGGSFSGDKSRGRVADARAGIRSGPGDSCVALQSRRRVQCERNAPHSFTQMWWIFAGAFADLLDQRSGVCVAQAVTQSLSRVVAATGGTGAAVIKSAALPFSTSSKKVSPRSCFASVSMTFRQVEFLSAARPQRRQARPMRRPVRE